MITKFIANLQRKPVLPVTILLYIVCVVVMGWIRFILLENSLVSIGYGLPLLVCLWYPDRRLLWGLMGTYGLMSAYKVFIVSSPVFQMAPFTVWAMQMVNMLVIGLAVHIVVELIASMRVQKSQLEESNQELMAREEEITRQNEELQGQTTELAEQNEEIQQQAEEVQQQAEELQAQAEELQVANSESNKRQAILQSLLDSLHVDASGELPERICHLLMSLLGESASAAVILEKEGDDLVVLAQAGPLGLPSRRWSFDRSFAAVVMGHDRTAYVSDLRLRPDLEGAQTTDSAFRSMIATPLRLAGKTVGVIKVYSDHAHEWTKEQFRIIEWMSAQCSLLMDSRRLQSELQRTNTDLDRIVKERTVELQELVNELEHFSYTITHDLRAPLRAMHGFAGLLAEDCMDSINEQSREYLKRITTAASRMDRLITDALSYSKAVRHEMPREEVNVDRLLRGMIDSYPIFQEPNAKIEIVGELPSVLGNEAALTQSFSNLIGNAVKFVAAGKVPSVRISVEQRGDRVRFWFEDNGIGIPKEMQSKVFVMFQRLSKDYEGTGIGLALVKKVVERMGGAVGVESEPGQGSRFWIELKTAGSRA
ncbi:sensor histidine kinase [Rariglobus hedericola]|uniref:histidine kinase n=1 Tax=Rariglobus hedericola TaxID=2597822 RepID=A0A556QL98_9BACT|nr:HAMP domain-containing sensor histidine kinase [Rariglobus hedericola]TSJ77416.1 HAMP domain-containing histidine kinase [Rariglobus hedericola]